MMWCTACDAGEDVEHGGGLCDWYTGIGMHLHGSLLGGTSARRPIFWWLRKKLDNLDLPHKSGKTCSKSFLPQAPVLSQQL